MSLPDLVRLKARRTFGEYRPSVLVENLSPDSQARAFARAESGRGAPVALFEAGNRWTLLTDSHLVGTTNLGVRALPLAMVGEDYRLRGDQESDDKVLLNWVSYDGETWFWAPSAPDLSLLLNVLLSAARRNGGLNA
ncbi:hypothetical protein [uncultured Caulobacter sp.]|uniref:hypothetical protein n=1 Tax=uncultured Caulobacter sp. TaxID=158749 RepID=UPI002603CE2F|nr:hypothetical protein [uncultured Caulobacter sp.]